MVVAEGDLKLERPYLRVEENSQAQLRCCRTASSELLTTTWFVKTKSNNKAAKVNESDGMIIDEVTRIDTTCHTLLLKSVHLNHTGLYQCQLSTSDLNITSPGTYLHVVRECLYVCSGGRGSNCSVNRYDMLTGVCV